MFRAGNFDGFLKMVTLLSMCCMVLLSACAIAPPYKEGLIINKQLQEAQAKAIASTSTDILDYASKIYVKAPIETKADHIIANKNLSAVKAYDHWDTQFFKIFCDEKNGELYQWSADRNSYAFGGFYGISKKIFTCEKDNKIESALLYESYGRDSTVFPYEIVTTYATNDYVEKFFEENKLQLSGPLSQDNKASSLRWCPSASSWPALPRF